MKRQMSLGAILLTIFSLAVISSCKKSDPVIGTGGSVKVADGFYITKSGVNPVSSGALVAEPVEDEAFKSQSREGFYANYVFLTAGSYNVVSVINQEISKVYGGTAAMATSTVGGGSDCSLQEYLLVEEFAENGAAFSIANAGLYKVIYDVNTKEIIAYKIEKGQIIGAASPAGWSSSASQDMALVGTASADGVKFEVAGIEMRPGLGGPADYKVRFNCRWGIDRRIVDGNHDFTNGYVAYTNYGGTLSALVAGGANFQIALGEDGIYTFDVNYSASGVKITKTKTQSLPPNTFSPTDFQWAITGSATANGWADTDPSNDPIGVDIDLNYDGVSSGTYTWSGTFPLHISDGGEFKFRTNDSWNTNIGFSTLDAANSSAAAVANLSDSGGNFKIAADATYTITIKTSDYGATWKVTFN